MLNGIALSGPRQILCHVVRVMSRSRSVGHSVTQSVDRPIGRQYSVSRVVLFFVGKKQIKKVNKKLNCMVYKISNENV